MIITFILHYLTQSLYLYHSEPYSFVCLIVRLAILVQYRRVTDERTDGLTYDDNTYHASIASRGKK